jgi:Rifampin ADP-ribosyl transferase
MDQASERFPEQYKKNGERAVFMYNRRHPSMGVNAMPAHISMGQFGPYFHGTDAELSPGDEVTSSASRGARRSTASNPSAPPQATADADHAVYAAHTKRGAGQYGTNVYEVEPTGHVHPDPESPELGVKSYGPMRVVRKAS